MSKNIDSQIIEYLKGKDFVSPSDIGIYFGKNYQQTSSWASPKLKKLVADGLVQRNKKGLYKLIETVAG